MSQSPTMNHRARKNASLRSAKMSWVPSMWRLTASVESMTMSTMARMSSSMSTLSTIPANFCLSTPRSWNALYIIVVDDMASIPPR